MAAKELNIYERLAKLRDLVSVMKKDTKGFNYMYVTLPSILSRLQGNMKKYKVSLIPSIVPGSTEVTPYSYKKIKVMKNGDIREETVNDVLVKSDMVWKWVCDDNPADEITVSWVSVGQQSEASQAFGSGLTYSMRYFLSQYFGIAQDDDPDKLQKVKKEAEAEEIRNVVSEIIEYIDQVVHDFLEENPEKRDAILEICKKYTKDGNYKSIKEPRVASKLMEEINKYIGEEGD